MLEQQQTWLVNGLQELYRRLLDGESWQGEPLKCEPNGHPLTHDLLTQLGALDSSKHERFEESADALQSELWKHSAGHMQRQDSSDTSSESAHSPIMPPQFASDPFSTRTTLPQTPTTLRIDLPRSAIKTEPHLTPSNSYMTSMQQQPLPMPGVVNPIQLENNNLQNQWSSAYPYEDIDIMSAQFVNYEDSMASPMFGRHVLSAPFLDNKSDFEDMQQYLNTHLEIAQ
ncbi:hypothetical protein BJY01DRAFT_53385 [Aspergillus pseudoustus]|uniref:Uncharacterized protein n=1 Tax=Aspergillus pseudoustus TaxID=1810923 RepID=A0ABR4J9D7_9EURO